MEKTYVCNRWPFYEIGSEVKFNRGLFVTADPRIQAIVESNDAYGVQIVDRDKVVDEPEVEEFDVPEEPTGGAVHGMRGTKKK